MVDVGGGVGKLRSLFILLEILFIDHSEQVCLADRGMVSYKTGGFDLQLSKLYPKLSFVVQDRGPVLQQAEHAVWPEGNPSAVAAGRVKFVQHDFFQQNPVQGAAVYWLRYVLYRPPSPPLFSPTWT